jgi:Flp pilus assembly protein TadG
VVSDVRGSRGAISWSGTAARTANRLRRDDGQAVYEFAVIALVLLVIVFGGIEFGRAWNNKNDVVHLANAAARMAVVGTVNCSALSTEATADGLPAVGGGSGKTNIVWTGADPTVDPNAHVDVTATAPFTAVVPKVIPGLPSTLIGKATMHAEQIIPAGSCP